MRVIGTAGHVDHGKSTLVQALTGTHPDRLKEEREREMTIDLGFAWLTLPDGEEVGIVDVPGHRDFIENMLAGVGGIDAALFVVAADEGVMPQTREHLAILDLLQIRGGVVALTKVDLVEDEEWLDLVESDLHAVFANTVLEQAPILRVSARTGTGVPELFQAISACLAGRPPRLNAGRPRLPVDRTFTIAGFGTIVTGTLSDGLLQVGDEVEVLPLGHRGRVRGLQTHKKKETVAVPGSRTAVNISGIAIEQAPRGSVIAHPGDYHSTRRLDASFSLLPDASGPVRHNMEVKLYLGAAEVVARLRLLGAEELLPGEKGWLQLETGEPLVAVRGDRYILRRPSPGETLGGGEVIDPHPRGRHKRFAAESLARLESLAAGSPSDVLFQALLALGAAPLREVMARSSLETGIAMQAAGELQRSGDMVAIEKQADPAPDAGLAPDDLVMGKGALDLLSARAVQIVEEYHKAQPLRLGMPREELRSRLKPLTRGSARLFTALLARLVDQGRLEETGPLVKHPSFSARFTPEQQAAVDRLLARFEASPFAPPSVKESQAEIGSEVFNLLVDTGRLVAVNSEVVFRSEDYRQMVDEVRRLIQQRGEVTAAEVRDHFNTSRRYVLGLLENLDATGITLRDGDYRRLRHG